MGRAKVFSDAELIAALRRTEGNKTKAAAELGVSLRNFVRRCAKLPSRGWSPEHDMTKTVPDGFKLRGTSTLYDEAGRLKLQWVKSTADQERQWELLQEAAKALCEDIAPLPPTALTPPKSNGDLLNCYVITDYHLGMLAWHEEAGEDWDVEIAESLIYRWFESAIELAPKADTAIFAQLADFLHWDGLEAVTPTKRHVLDADTRFQKLVRVSIRVIRRITDALLKKYQKVVLVQPGGNHDPASTIWLRELFYTLYDREPRVTVDRSADVYAHYEHGLTSLFFHHGHKRRPESVDSVFVAKYRDVFGRTKYSYAHMGHMHHVKVLETNLMLIEQHRTLAAKDAYAANGGYMAGRDAKVITYHKQFGEVARLTISPEMLK